MRRLILSAILCAAVVPLQANDWPNYRGPNHNGISAETGWQAKWPADGPTQLWKASVGTGFSSITVGGGRAYTMGNTADVDTVFCFDAETGKVIWQKPYPSTIDPQFYEGGPSATPTIDGDKVYTLSKHGDLYCFAADSGTVIWTKNIATELSLSLPQWEFASSALIERNMLLLNIGTEGVALDKTTGSVIWSTGTKASGYSTPLPYTFAGRPALALMTADGAASVDMATGSNLWRFPLKGDYKINSAEPVLVGDKIFVSSMYSKTDALLDPKSPTPVAVWKNRNLRNQVSSTVFLDGYLYGVDGTSGPSADASLKCVDAQTGSVKWNFPDLGGGALMIADGKIIALSDKGELFAAAASPQSFTPISRAQVLGGRCWTVPTLANGRIYCRNAKGDVVCLDVKMQ